MSASDKGFEYKEIIYKGNEQRLSPGKKIPVEDLSFTVAEGSFYKGWIWTTWRSDVPCSLKCKKDSQVFVRGKKSVSIPRRRCVCWEVMEVEKVELSWLVGNTEWKENTVFKMRGDRRVFTLYMNLSKG